MPYIRIYIKSYSGAAFLAQWRNSVQFELIMPVVNIEVVCIAVARLP